MVPTRTMSPLTPSWEGSSPPSPWCCCARPRCCCVTSTGTTARTAPTRPRVRSSAERAARPPARTRARGTPWTSAERSSSSERRCSALRPGHRHPGKSRNPFRQQRFYVSLKQAPGTCRLVPKDGPNGPRQSVGTNFVCNVLQKSARPPADSCSGPLRIFPGSKEKFRNHYHTW